MTTNFNETTLSFGVLHKNILELGLCLGFKLPSTGICYGFTIRWIEACLSNTQDLFRRRTQHIISLSNKRYWLKCELWRLKTQTPHNTLFWDIVAFFESCAIYQSPHHYFDIFLISLLQRQIQHISRIASSDEIFHMGGIDQTKVIYYGEFNLINLKSFAHLFASVVDDYQYQKPLAIVMTCLENHGFHSVGLTYTSSTQTWHYMDINRNPLSTNTTCIDEMCRQISRMNSYCFSIKLIFTANFNHSALLAQLINLQQSIKLPKPGHLRQALFSLAVYEMDDKLVSTLLLDDKLNITQAIQNATHPLMIALSNNYLSILNMILSDKRTDPNCLTKDGFFPLYIAAKQGNLQSLKLLLAHHQINPNLMIENGDTALHIAVIKGHLDIVKELLCHREIAPNQSNKYQISPLHIATFQGDNNILKALLEHKNIDPNCAMKDGTTSLIISIFKGKIDIFYTLLLTNGLQIDKPFFSGRTELITFISQFNKQVRARMNKFLELQLNLSPTVITPLILAQILGYPNMVEALQEKAPKVRGKCLEFASSLSPS